MILKPRTYPLLIIILLQCNCTNKSKHDIPAKKQDTVNAIANTIIPDSVKLTKLVRDLYKWYEKTGEDDEQGAFKPQKKNIADTLYTSIDLVAHEEAIDNLWNTNFFTNNFLDQYRNIAVRMDKELKNGTSTWRDGELPSFNDDVDAWCNCQDYPDNYWEKLTLKNIKINGEEASFEWVWGHDPNVEDNKDFGYKVKAKKESGVWKISYLAGFDMKWYNWAK